MFNLLIGFPPGVAFGSRIGEYTEEHIRGYISPHGRLDISRVINLPTLVMPETGDTDTEQVARIGHLEHMTPSGADYRFRFVPTPGLPPVPTHAIEDLASELAIGGFEFTRTHWAVKDIDLHRALAHVINQLTIPGASVLNFPVAEVREADLVAVMMPFDAAFTPVYSALQQAAVDAGMRCHRADDIWRHEHIMDDVVSLIWRAGVVIADLSAKNTNVFYETGIAHTLGRNVILIAQSMDDVPFDLRPIRAIRYLHNAEGRQSLREQVAGRLAGLRIRS